MGYLHLSGLQQNGRTRRRWVFQSVRDRFSKISDPGLYKLVDSLKNFRNTCVAHQDKEILDKDAAKSALKEWIDGLIKIYKSHHK